MKLKIVTLATIACLASGSIAQAQTHWIEPIDIPFPINPTPGPVNPTPVPINIPVPGVGPSTPDTGETLIRIGIPDRNPGQRLQGIDYTTTEIDNWLRMQSSVSLGLADLTLDFGNNYTRDLLNAGFEEIRLAERDLEDGAARAIENELSLISKVYTLDFDVSPFSARFRQSGQNLDADIGALSGSIVAKAKVPVCGTIKVRGRVDELSTTARYNLVTGDNINVGLKVEEVSLKESTGNPLKWACVSVVKQFANVIALATGNGIPYLTAFDNKLAFTINESFDLKDPNLLGLNDVFGTARAFLGSGTINNDFVEAQRLAALKAINTAERIVSDPSFQGSGLQVNLKYADEGDNEVGLTVSHNPVDIGFIEYGHHYMDINLNRGANTKRTYIYSKAPGQSNWRLMTSTNTGTAITPLVQNGTQVIAVGESNAVSGLYSFPGRPGTIRSPFVDCRRAGRQCPDLY